MRTPFNTSFLYICGPFHQRGVCTKGKQMPHNECKITKGMAVNHNVSKQEN